MGTHIFAPSTINSQHQQSTDVCALAVDGLDYTHGPKQITFFGEKLSNAGISSFSSQMLPAYVTVSIVQSARVIDYDRIRLTRSATGGGDGCRVKPILSSISTFASG